jgi:hypothetical protein
MKILIMVFLFSFSLMADESEMKFIRETFYLAVEDEEALEELENYIINKYSNNPSVYPPVILAYSGGVEALKAKHVFSPFSKFSHLMRSLDVLDEAVSRKPGDLEVRFLRFSVLDNIPSFLGYGKERNEDKEVIIAELMKKDYRQIDKQTQKGLTEYLLESSNLSDEEKLLLNNYYNLVYGE